VQVSVVLDEDSEPLLGIDLTAHPGGTKAVDPHPEGVKPRIVKVVFSIEGVQKHCSNDGATVFEELSTEQECCFGVDRCIEAVQLTIDPNRVLNM